MFDSISLYRALGFEVKKPDIIKMVHEVDPTNTGTVDYEQFLEIMVDKYAERDPEEEIKKAFGLFDEDHTGKITLKNMKCAKYFRKQNALERLLHGLAFGGTQRTHLQSVAEAPLESLAEAPLARRGLAF